MHIAITHDRVDDKARPDELDVLIQARAVAHSLVRLGHTAEPIPFDLNLAATADTLSRSRCDLVFNIVESIGGQGRLIHLAPALLDTLQLPYTGARTDAMYLTSNKVLAKRMLAAAGLPTPHSMGIQPTAGAPHNCSRTNRDATAFRAGAYIVKSVWEEASLGLDDRSVIEVETAEELSEAIELRCDALGGEAFAEAYIDGREFNLAILETPDGWRVLPPAEIQFVNYPDDKPRIVGYAAKWDAESHEYNNTPRRFDFPGEDKTLVARLTELAFGCCELFNLRGYARVDFRVDVDGNPWIMEVNTNPCIAPDAGFFAAAERAGLDFDDVIRQIVDAALTPAAATRSL